MGDQAHLRGQNDSPFKGGLKVLRMKSLDQLTQVTQRIDSTMKTFSKLEDNQQMLASLKDPRQVKSMVEGINEHLTALKVCLDIVKRYF